MPPPQPYTRTPIGSQCDFNPLRLPHCDFNPIQDFDATSDFNPVATSTIAPFPPQSVHYYLDWAPARVPRSGAPERSEHCAVICCGGSGVGGGVYILFGSKSFFSVKIVFFVRIIIVGGASGAATPLPPQQMTAQCSLRSGAPLRGTLAGAQSR